MRNGGNILNQGYIQTGGLKCADGSFTAGTGAFNENFHRLHTMLHSSLSSNLGSSLCSKGSRLLGTTETHFAGRRPRNGIALRVRDGYDGVVEG